MVVENLRIDVTPGGVPLVIHVSQYDAGLRQFNFTPYDKGVQMAKISGATVTMEATKPDGYAVQHPCTYNNDGTITYVLQEQLAAVEGQVWSKLTWRNSSGDILGAKAIIWAVDTAGIEDGAVVSESDLPLIEQAAEFASEYEEKVADMIAEMQIVPGQVVIDGTLTVPGAAADAKATGDRFKADEKELWTDDIKTALLTCFQNVAWINEHGEDYYRALEIALSDNKPYEVQSYPGTLSLFSGTPAFLPGSITDGILLMNTGTSLLNRRMFAVRTGVHAMEEASPIEGNVFPIPIPSGMSTAHISIYPSPMQILAQIWRYDPANSVYKLVSVSTWGQDTLATFEAEDNLYLAVNARANSSNVDFTEEPSALTVLFAQSGYPKLTAEFNPGGAQIYDDNTLDDLRNYLTVKYEKSPNDFDVVTGYTLSGSLSSAQSTITATYRGLSTTFSVNVNIGRPLTASDILSHIGYSDFSIDGSGNISSSSTAGFSILALSQDIKHIRYDPSFVDFDTRKDVPLWAAFYKNSDNTFVCCDTGAVYKFTPNGARYNATQDSSLGSTTITNYSLFTATGKKDVVLRDGSMIISEADQPTATLVATAANIIGVWSNGSQNSCPKNVRVYAD